MHTDQSSLDLFLDEITHSLDFSGKDTNEYTEYTDLDLVHDSDMSFSSSFSSSFFQSEQPKTFAKPIITVLEAEAELDLNIDFGSDIVESLEAQLEREVPPVEAPVETIKNKSITSDSIDEFYHNYTTDTFPNYGITPPHDIKTLFPELYKADPSLFISTSTPSNSTTPEIMTTLELSNSIPSDIQPFEQCQGGELDSYVEDLDLDSVIPLYSPHSLPPVKQQVNALFQPPKQENNVDLLQNAGKDSERFTISGPNPLHLSVHFDDTTVTCLHCSINYNGYTGTVNNVTKLSSYLVNQYQNSGLEPVPPNVTMLYQERGISSSSCVHQRVKYDRDISELHGTITNIVYKTSAVYSLDTPYEPQYYRFEIGSDGEKLNESKCGLCPYCEEVKFLPFKNSSYLSHLTLEHGIFSNNFMTPEGLHYGKYQIRKRDRNGTGKKDHRSRTVDAMLCAHCKEIIEVGCWSMKSNKLLSYFRHFKNAHSEETTKSGLACQLPEIKPRGRTLHVVD